MFELGVNADAAIEVFKEVGKRVNKAQRTGIRKAGGVVRKTFRANVSVTGTAGAGKLALRSGQYRKGLKLKTFQYKNKSWGASIRVRGQHGFVFRLHETGYTDRGGGQVVARQPGQAALKQHASEIPVMIERFVKEALTGL